MKLSSMGWSRQRRAAVAAAIAIACLFIAANAHLVTVSFATMPACVAPAVEDQVPLLRVAKPAC